MSDTQAQKPSGGVRIELWVIAALVAIVLGAALYLSGQRQPALRASATGFDGLHTWLGANGLPVQNFFGGWQIDQDQVDLLIVPLFDTDLVNRRDPPQNAEEFLLQQDEYDGSLAALQQRIERVPTLIILPKWRSGLRLTGLGHPMLLSDSDRIEMLFRSITGHENAQLRRSERAFSDLRYDGDDVRNVQVSLYAAQSVANSECRPLIGDPRNMVLGDCPVGESKTRALILVDPDLLNNHGLRLGDNANVAADLIAAWVGNAAERSGRDADAEAVGEGQILIDYARSNWVFESRQSVARERSWSDLGRFFGPPFTALWIGAAACLALFMWRGGLRDRPVRGVNRRSGASKTVAIGARARLMRLSDQDGQLVGAYASARIATAAATLLGPANAPAYSSDEAFQRYVARRHPTYAERLSATLTRLRALPARITAQDAARHVQDFEAVLEDILHDT